MRAMCVFSPNVLFFQEVMNRCMSANGEKRKKKRIDGAGSRSTTSLLDLSLCWPHQTRKAEKETSKILFLF